MLEKTAGKYCVGDEVHTLHVYYIDCIVGIFC